MIFPSGFLMALVIGLVFLGTGIYTVKSPELSLFRGMGTIDKEVGGADPSPPERVIAKIGGYILILLGTVWLYFVLL